MQNRNIIGESALFLEMLEKVSKVAAIQRPVLIIGPRGSGKELIAQRLHFLSSRWDQPFVALNCAALSENLIDSELFGHESGSFTGSRGKHEGRFERAEGGTFFLDELATAPIVVQEKLLRVIEYGEFERVGGSKTLKADVRLVCATNENLPQLAAQGDFRADLLDRLAFDVIHVPALSQRPEDIPLLAKHFAMGMCRELGLPLFGGFTEDALAALVAFPWPGNIRELKNVVERAVYQNPEPNTPISELIFDPFQQSIDNSALIVNEHAIDDTEPSQNSIISADISLPLEYKQWSENNDIALLTQTLEHAKHNQKAAADLLGLSYHQFRGMMRKYKL
ncbi:ATPase AAA [Vibrio sp. qd031]|uniref:phage shock protein operon transcriptional activator n=1 Tax=Vibrio sp. qd031 TaxID=1603038 RepID=UPI000A11536B|nr:phage shock protein operon transcriptional activator [Vibrio sp. qd031]ORT50058.1 ATPase AAA [Vibrio sp. qd031]